MNCRIFGTISRPHQLQNLAIQFFKKYNSLGGFTFAEVVMELCILEWLFNRCVHSYMLKQMNLGHDGTFSTMSITNCNLTIFCAFWVSENDGVLLPENVTSSFFKDTLPTIVCLLFFFFYYYFYQSQISLASSSASF